MRDPMFVAFDVQYVETRAAAAAVLFEGWTSITATDEVLTTVEDVAPYVPGSFYLRELPCLLAALRIVEARHGQPALLFVDGYVNLEPGHPGLGRRLHDATGIPVVGVAKTRFHQAEAVEVTRGASKAPLFVTAVGCEVAIAAQGVLRMSGPYRIPTLLQQVDHLARKGARGLSVPALSEGQ